MMRRRRMRDMLLGCGVYIKVLCSAELLESGFERGQLATETIGVMRMCGEPIQGINEECAGGKFGIQRGKPDVRLIPNLPGDMDPPCDIAAVLHASQ